MARGFFAELNYQIQQAEKRQRQQSAQAIRAHNAAVREVERAQKAAVRAQLAAHRASEAERKAAEKEAARLQFEARTAEVAALNADLVAAYEEIDSMLAWTLGFDDFVDLETLKVSVEHPPFDPGDLKNPIGPAPELVYPPQPTYAEPPPMTGLSGVFVGKKKHAAAVEEAKAKHEQAKKSWHEAALKQHAEHVQKLAELEQAEKDRIAKVAEARAAYERECEQRVAEADERNAELARFINDLAFDVEYAIQDYVGIVLSNSVYPDSFPVDHEHYQFDLGSRELRLQVSIPEPSSVPSAKEYRYVKARDEIVASPLPVKTQKDRYNSAVHQVAVRSLHEIFEADRAGKIHSVALKVGVSRMAPATGLPEFVPLVVIGADRASFETLDLNNVVPAATLDHLGGAVSKSPFDLVAADASRSVRQRPQ